MPIVREVADDVLVLSHGRIVERSTPDELIHHPKHAYSRDLLARTARIWSEGPPPLPPPSTAKAILSVQDVTKTYSVPDRSRFFGTQAVQAVRGVSFDVLEGDNFGLVGESGCGKSTLSRLLSWIEQPDRGTILFDGQDIGAMGRAPAADHAPGLPAAAAGPLQLHPAEPDRRPDDRPAAEGARHPPARDRGQGQGGDGRGRDCRPISPTGCRSGLSAGQRQRINIARALVLEPRLLILDETLSALDPMEQGRLLELFAKLQSAHRLTYLFISHDLAMVRKVCSRIAVMYLGKIVELADTGTVFFDPGHPYTRALLSAVPVLEEQPYKAEECLLEGEPPSPIDLPAGCSFRARCPLAFDRCRIEEPPLYPRGPGRVAACHLVESDERAPRAA